MCVEPSSLSLDARELAGQYFGLAVKGQRAGLLPGAVTGVERDDRDTGRDRLLDHRGPAHPGRAGLTAMPSTLLSMAFWMNVDWSGTCRSWST